MSSKNIQLGVIQIIDWSLKDKLFPDYYYNKEDDYYEASFEKEIKDCDPNEVVLPANTNYTLVIDYPLSNAYEKKFTTSNKGMTRLKLVDFICKQYRKVYVEEDGSTNVKAGLIPGMYNRNTTDGKYGIWGHELGDLVLIDAKVSSSGKITLGVDS